MCHFFMLQSQHITAHICSIISAVPDADDAVASNNGGGANVECEGVQLLQRCCHSRRLVLGMEQVQLLVQGAV